MMGHKCSAYKISDILLVIGGLNWGLVGAMNLNVVDMLGAMIARVVYVLVGVAALVVVAHMAGMCKCTKEECKDGKCEMHGGSKGPSMGGKM